MAEPAPKRFRKTYKSNEALDIILNDDDDIPEGSDDENLSDEDENWDPATTMDRQQDSDDDDDEEFEETIMNAPSSSKSDTSSKRPVRTWHWVKKDLPPHVNPDNALIAKGPALNNRTPLDAFCAFFDDDIMEHLVLETNRHREAIRRLNVSPVTLQDLRTFFGICLYMTIVELPFRRMYWSPGSKQSVVSNAMTINRYEEILSIIHVNDNQLEKKRGEPGHDRLHKVRPLIAALNENFDKCAEKEMHVSVDEQIIPFKGRHSLKVYMMKKPKKWGYKVWVMAGQSGYVHKFKFAGDNLAEDHPANDVDSYRAREGTGTPQRKRVRNAAPSASSSPASASSSSSKQPNDLGEENIGKSGEIVLTLVRDQPQFSYTYFDNYFSSPDLLAALKKKNIHATCTLRGNRSRNCPVMCVKDLKRKGRGAFDFRQDQEDSILICSWYDNKVVTVASNIHGVEPTNEVRRYDRSKKEHIQVKCPGLIQNYNQNMGGVDKCDMLMALYRNEMKSKKWYKRIIFHLVDLCVVNAWLLYRAMKGDDCKIPLAFFKFDVAKALIISRKVLVPLELEPTPRALNSVSAKDVNQDARYDKVDHFPKKMNVKNGQRCKMESCKRKSMFMCRKCCVYLCMTGDGEDCFYMFHHR